MARPSSDAVNRRSMESSRLSAAYGHLYHLQRGWTRGNRAGMYGARRRPPADLSKPDSPTRHEELPAALLHLVERPDLRHAAVDRALRGAGRRGRVRQPLLPHQGPQDRSDAGFRAALGDLQRRRRSLLRATDLAWLAAPYGRRI